MSTNALPAVSPEVTAFAAEAGVSAYLPAVVEMTGRIFPGAPLKTYLEDDPDLPEDRAVIIQVDVADFTFEQLSAGQGFWDREVFRACSSTHVHLFRLRMV
jgi:hypothetical protein